jgi:hypothetical protein
VKRLDGNTGDRLSKDIITFCKAELELVSMCPNIVICNLVTINNWYVIIIKDKRMNGYE